MKRLLPYLHWLIALLLFFFYTFPLWSGKPYFPTVISYDSLNLETVPRYLANEQGRFVKYGIGAYLLEWSVVGAIARLADMDVASASFLHTSNVISAWYHCLLATLSGLVLFYLFRSYSNYRESLFGMTLFGLSPPVVFWSITSSVDIPFLTFGLLSIFCLDRWRRGLSVWWAPATGVFAASAFMNKEFFGLILLFYPLLFLSFKQGWKKPRFVKSLLPGGFLAFGGFCIVAFILSLYWKDPQLYIEHIKAYLPGGRINQNWQPTLRPVLSGLIPALLATITAVQSTAAGTLLGIAGGFRFIKTKVFVIVLLLLPTIPYFLLVQVRYSEVRYQYLFPLLPGAIALSVLGLEALMEQSKKGFRQAGIALAVIALAASLGQSLVLHHDIHTDPRLALRTFAANVNESDRSVLSAAYTDPSRIFVGWSSAEPVNVYREWPLSDEVVKTLPEFVVIDQASANRIIQKAGLEKTMAGKKLMADRLVNKKQCYDLSNMFLNNRKFWKMRYRGINENYYVFQKKKSCSG